MSIIYLFLVIVTKGAHYYIVSSGGNKCLTVGELASGGYNAHSLGSKERNIFWGTYIF